MKGASRPASAPLCGDAAEARARMVERQLRRRGILDERVLSAMQRVPREVFVPEHLQHLAYEDGALPIGFGQTISQPFIVATICALLELDRRGARARRGNGIGVPGRSSCGAGRRGGHDRARARARRDGPRGASAGRARATSRCVVGDGSLGVPERAPFDAIAVAAAAPTVPPALYDQLAEGGRLVLPARRALGTGARARRADGRRARSSAGRSRAGSSRSSARRGSRVADPSGGGPRRSRAYPARPVDSTAELRAGLSRARMGAALRRRAELGAARQVLRRRRDRLRRQPRRLHAARRRSSTSTTSRPQSARSSSR